jgi:thiol-disulfide isomerase/thioredoxin
MKKKLLTGILFFLIFSLNSIAQGINFMEGSWEEVLTKAQKDKKAIFVDAYTKWCGPCKRLQSTVFPTKEAGDFYNQNFINFKIDMETQSGIEFGTKYPVSAYPTLYFISNKGEVIQTQVGGADVKRFIEIGKEALSQNNYNPELEAEWDKGNRDYDVVLSYIKSLKSKDKPINKIVLDYLKEKPNIDKDQKLVLIFESVTECDSKLFEMLTEKANFKKLFEIYSNEEISEKIYTACWKTVEKSYEYDAPILQEEAKEKMKNLQKDRYKEFNAKIDLFNAENTGDFELYKKAAMNFFQELKTTDARISFVDQIPINTKSKNEAIELKEELSKKCLEKEETPKTYLSYLRALVENKKIEEARKHIAKAVKLATDNEDADTLRAIKRFEIYLQREDINGK